MYKAIFATLIKFNFRTVASVFIIACAFVSLTSSPFVEARFNLFERSILLALLLVLSAPQGVNELRFLEIPTFTGLLILLSGISILQFPQFNILKDWMGFVGILLFALLTVRLIPLKNVVLGITTGTLLLIAWSFICLVYMPEYSWATSGEFIGPTYHWNSLAFSLCLGLPAVLATQIEKVPASLRVAIKILIICSIEFLIVLTTSKSSLIASIFILVIYGTLLITIKNRIAGVIITSVFGIFTLIGVINFATITNILGKSVSLTGRVPLWNSIWSHLFEKPITGYGWSTLFNNDSPVYRFVTLESGIPARHAHNDLLQWGILSGVPSAVTILITYLLLLAGSLFVLIKRNEFFGVWVFTATAGLGFQGLTEISSAHPQGWLVLCILYSALFGKLITDEPFSQWLYFRKNIPFSREIPGHH